MKKILLFGIVLLFHFVATAQFSGPIHVINHTACPITMDLIASAPGIPCSAPQYATTTTTIPPMGTMIFTYLSLVDGTPQPAPSTCTWELARVYDNCGGIWVGDPSCYTTTAVLHSCCGAHMVTWNVSLHELTIN